MDSSVCSISERLFPLCSVYGQKPFTNEKVIFSKHRGGGHDRAHPVVKAKK